MNCIAVPSKYRELGDFHQYYSGAKKAPYLTVFVGGNHEASNYLTELYYGGWVAPNIYYLGAANVIKLGPLRIASLSGIWKGYNYRKPHFERLPYNDDDIKSVYHVRELDTRKLLQIRTQVDVGISHDWPQGIEWNGNWKQLFKRKPFLEDDARNRCLGSNAAKSVLDRLRPAYWFSAHLHAKHSAVKKFDIDVEPRLHQTEIRNRQADSSHQHANPLPKNENEIELDLEDSGEEAAVSARPQDKQHLNKDEIELDLGIEGDEQEEAQPEQKLKVGNAQYSHEIDMERQDQNSKMPDPDSQVNDEFADEDQPTIRNGQHTSTSHKTGPSVMMATEISEDVRAQLPAAFKKPMPYPSDIWNKTTRFLALDKCLPGRDFLQLMEIKPLKEEETETGITRPLKLMYDKEWLAIIRVFANELTFGNESTPVPPNKGQQFYLQRIEEQERWVEENVIKTGKICIPDNFQQTAPPYDPIQGAKISGQPREYINPQTRTFCELLQIDNAFESTDEQIAARAQAGLRPSSRSRGGNHGQGPRGGGGFGRHQGRGRGRGGARRQPARW